MARLSLVGIVPPSRRSTIRLLLSAVLCALLLIGTSTLAGAASSKASAATISARLTKTSFKSSQARSVKLIYKFSAPSKTFAYKLTIRKGSKWLKVKSVKKTGTFKSSKSMTVKKVFAGKSIKVGTYRLKLSADGGSKLLGFKVVTGVSAPANTVLPTTPGVSAGGAHSCALSSSGTVTCWGINSYGQLGNDTHTDSVAPVQVKGVGRKGILSNVAQISAGFDHTCALSSSGTVTCWGYNEEGWLGTGSSTGGDTPVRVEGVGRKGWLSNVTQISAGGGHTCALLADHTVDCWGYDDYGELGDRGEVVLESSTPVPVAGVGGKGTLSKVTQISAGLSHTCALLADHTVDCWGQNYHGQVGNGSILDSDDCECGIDYPVKVKGVGGRGTLSNVTRISAGGSHTCALQTGGTVKCWGYGGDGELGNGSTASRLTPVPVSGITNATTLSGGYEHTCALLTSGTVKCWGYNEYGQLGNGTLASSSTPAQVIGVDGAGALVNVTQISASNDHTCVSQPDGAIKCWGWNKYGQLGNGTTTNSSTPVQVVGVGGAGTLSKVTQISVGDDHTGAVLSRKKIKCWFIPPRSDSRVLTPE